MTDPKAQIVISGGTGLIGRRLVGRVRSFFEHEKPELLQGPVEAFIWDQLSDYERLGRSKLPKTGFRLIEGDLVTGTELKEVTKSPSVIFHLAASTDTNKKDHRCNTVGTRNFIEALGPLGPETHVLYTGTLAVWDNRPDYSIPLDEESTVYEEPSTAYGSTKLEAENWLKEQAKIHRFPLTIVKLPTTYASGYRPKSFFDELKRVVLAGSIIGRLNWPGLTSLVHADDVVDALLKFSLRPPAPGESQTFIPHAEAVTLADVCRVIHASYGIPYRPIRLPRFAWDLIRLVTRRKHLLKPVLPVKLYAVLWRLSIIVDSIFWADTERLRTALPDWRPKKLETSVKEVLSI